MRLADEDIPEEEANDPYHDEPHRAIYYTLECEAFAFCENSLIEEHEADFNQAQGGDLHQFNRP